jgi:hypothetical protein
LRKRSTLRFREWDAENISIKSEEMRGRLRNLHNKELQNLYASQNIVTFRLKVGIVEPEETSITRQRLG